MKADGSQRILFSTVRDIVSSARCGAFILLVTGGGQLTRTDADGLNATELVHAGATPPSCPADGKSIYYADEESRPQRILRLPVEGDTPVEFAKIPGEGLTSDVVVSPDGKLVAYIYHESGPNPVQRLLVIPFEGGPPMKSFLGISGDIQWTPDGRGIEYYEARDGIRQIMEQPLGGGTPRALTNFTSGKIFGFSWSPDGKQLYVIHGETNSDAVLITNFP
jgi:hypothetical protein